MSTKQESITTRALRFETLGKVYNAKRDKFMAAKMFDAARVLRAEAENRKGEPNIGEFYD